MPEPIEAVLFDFHSTLVDQGEAADWVGRAWRASGRDVETRVDLDALTAWADRIWEHARTIDPDNRRDRSPEDHREVFDLVARQAPGPEGVPVEPAFVDALYRTLLDLWVPYDDAIPVLTELRRRGVRTALLSNVGLDVRPVLQRFGLLDHLDAVVLSYEVGAVKPEPEIFAHALEEVGVPAARALMVGDSWRDDGGAGELGVRTLILPRTRGAIHGLDAVLRLVG